jgi:polyisoprenoid-binding protein YceI
MKSICHIALSAISTFSIVGCSDPARDVTQSDVSDAIETASTPANAVGYTIDAESTIGFVGSKVTGSHEGGFNEFSGTIYLAGGKLAASSTIEIDMTSTWSDNDRLTGHLVGEDFFDVENHPTSTFTLTTSSKAAGATHLTGNLALHGVTNSISFPAQVEVSDDAVSVSAEFAINRKDFEITYPGKPDDLIRDNVVLKLAIDATRSE